MSQLFSEKVCKILSIQSCTLYSNFLFAIFLDHLHHSMVPGKQ